MDWILTACSYSRVVYWHACNMCKEVGGTLTVLISTLPVLISTHCTDQYTHWSVYTLTDHKGVTLCGLLFYVITVACGQTPRNSACCHSITGF